MSAFPVQTATVQQLPALAPLQPSATTASPLTTHRGRRRTAAQALGLTPAGQGASLVRTQQLPLQASATVRVGNPILFAIAGAAIGTLLLGIPGTIIGGIAGYLIAR